MAAVSYYSTLIKQDIIGTNENISVSQAVSLNQFLQSIGQEKYIISSFNLWTSCRNQVTQPLRILKTRPDGEQVIETKVPQLSSYQIQNQLIGYTLDQLEFDQDSKFEYEILGNCQVQLILNIDDSVRDVLSNADQLKSTIELPKTPLDDEPQDFKEQETTRETEVKSVEKQAKVSKFIEQNELMILAILIAIGLISSIGNE